MDRVEEAFRHTPRANFVPETYRGQVDVDAPLPIGFGQTISQPTTVRLMLEWLGVQPGDKVLDVGSGSGWTTALLSYLVGKRGRVYAVEAVPELVEFGRENCRRLNLANVSFYKAGSAYGLPQQAPYDRILVSAAAHEVPSELRSQLRIGGKLVIPVWHDILELAKTSESEWEAAAHPGFMFVPLVMPAD